MSYWSSGYNSVLGPGALRLPVQTDAADAESPETALEAGFDLTEIAFERELFRSFTVATWTTSAKKRAFDVLVCSPALLACLPLMGVLAVLIKCSSRGPVLFRQERVGLGQKPFTIYKFRTMDSGSDCVGPSVTRKGDCRLTGIGRVLRKLKLDELPQLYNVLRGDMSLVGPRPKLAQHEQMYLFCRPGITGAATLVFAHEEEILSNVPHQHVESYTIGVLNPIKARLDLEYANAATLRSDIRMLLDTVFRLSGNQPGLALPEFVEVAYSSQDEALEL